MVNVTEISNSLFINRLASGRTKRHNSFIELFALAQISTNSIRYQIFEDGVLINEYNHPADAVGTFNKLIEGN